MSESLRRILVVDDQEQNRYILRRILERAGYACETASRGREAIEKAAWLPDLIILDVKLPDISGYEVCRHIKDNPLTARIPVLQVSAALMSSEAKVRALEAGADVYLTHPIDGVVLVATVRSLLRLRDADAAAREAAAQWQSTFDALSEGLAVADANGALVQYNQAFEDFCGGACDVHRGVPAAQILRQILATEVPTDLLNGSRRSMECIVEQRTLLLAIHPISNGAGGHILVLNDITDRKLAEYALRTAEQLAATGRMAHAIAHEINNPLESLINLIYLANNATARDDVRSYLSMANAELERVARITKQSLAFHRDTQHPVPVDIGSLLGEVVSLYTRVAAGKQITLAYRQTPTLAIQGFPGQLMQVFSNLIRNAIEATPPHGRIDIRVRPCRVASREGTRVTVHDGGPGIPASVQEKIFDPFFTTKELRGSGLGLWVSKALVAHHGGEIRFRSSSGSRRGTTFQVCLPLGGLEQARTAGETAA